MKVRESNLLMHPAPEDTDAKRQRQSDNHDRYAIALFTSRLTQVLGEVFLIMRRSYNLALLIG